MRVSLVQMIVEHGKIEDNFTRIINQINYAVDEKCEIICFPEYALTGMINEIEYNENVNTIHNAVDELQKIADKENICILIGLVEKIDGELYNSQKVVMPNRPIDEYKKIGLGKKELALYSQGNEINVFEYKDLKFGIATCYENHFPIHIRNIAKKGANVIFAPHYMPSMNAIKRLEVWNKYMPARAYDNRIYMLACNALKNKEDSSTGGAIGVWDFNGNITTKYTLQTEKLITVDLDLAEQSKYLSKTKDKKYRNFLDDEHLFKSITE